MTKPVTIPNTFATATTAIPLSNLDADFSTVATAMNDANTYSNYAPDTGSANAYVVTLTGVSTTYSAGLRIQFKAGNANTTASTLNVNAQGAKNITYQDASAIASGTIAANSIVDVMYDGTQFLLMNDPAGGTGGDVVGPALATDNAIVRFDGGTGKLVQNSVVTIADSTGDISGVGQLNATTVDATNVEVTNIKAKDGTAAATIADSTGVVTVTAAPVMTALTASQAVFTTAGKALTSNAITGTGNVVMSASPTLTGTVSAAAATLSSDLTLNGGTANGVLYLNGSKVATSGSALTFDGTRLAIGGGTNGSLLSVKLVGAMAGFDTGAAADGRVEYAYNGTNIFYTGIDSASLMSLWARTGVSLAFGANNAEAMRLTSTSLYTASGINVGIGTSSPSVKLDVSGTASINGDARFVAKIADTSSVAQGNGGGIVFRGVYTGTTLVDAAGIQAYKVNATDNNYSYGLAFSTRANGGNLTANMRLDESGNLGLGVTPSAWTTLRVMQFAGGASLAGFSNTGYLNANAYFDGSWRYISTATAGRYEVAADHKWFTAASGTAGNAISFTQALTLDANGDLLLGSTSNPGTVSGRNFLMNAPSSVANKITFAINNAQTGYVYNSASELSFGYPSSGSLQFQIVSGSTVARFDSSGNLLLGGASTPTSSAGNLVMFNGTAPTGNVTNGCTLFCEDVSSSSELKVRDEAGNVTTLSPHNFSLIPEGPSEDMAWSYYSERDGKRINIDMLKAIRLLEKISGEQLVYEA